MVSDSSCGEVVAPHSHSHSQPILTQSMTSLDSLLSGDTVTQRVEQEQEPQVAMLQLSQFQMLQSRLEAMETAFLIQEKALSQSVGSEKSKHSENSFPYHILLNQWRKTTCEAIYSRLVGEKSATHLSKRYHQLRQQSQQQQLEYEATQLAHQQYVHNNHLVINSLKQQVQEATWQLAQEKLSRKQGLEKSQDQQLWLIEIG